MAKTLHRFAYSLIGPLMLSVAAWASTVAHATEQPLFGTDFTNLKPLPVQLTGPFKKLAADRNPEPEEHAGNLVLSNSNTAFDIALQPRGKSRRRPENCRFPPLWLKFKKDQVRDSVLRGHHKRKLVTHCRRLRSKPEGSKVWLEMLAYRTLNLLSDTSYRVAPLQITYIDSDDPEQTYTHAGFLIEHKKELARRLDLKAKKRDRVPHAQLDQDYSALVAVFNLFIGNPDFSVSKGPAGESCCHNTVPFENAAGQIRSVPYDFDNTGLVRPRYASVSDQLSITSVTQRIYRGYCRHNAGVAAAIAQLVEARATIEALFDTHPDISKSEKQRALRFIDRFYDRYSSAKGQARLQGRCLG